MEGIIEENIKDFIDEEKKESPEKQDEEKKESSEKQDEE